MLATKLRSSSSSFASNLANLSSVLLAFLGWAPSDPSVKVDSAFAFNSLRSNRFERRFTALSWLILSFFMIMWWCSFDVHALICLVDIHIMFLLVESQRVATEWDIWFNVVWCKESQYTDACFSRFSHDWYRRAEEGQTQNIANVMLRSQWKTWVSHEKLWNFESPYYCLTIID